MNERRYAILIMQSTTERNYKKKVVDVCCHNLVKSVKCNQPCTEGYGADNLVSNRLMDKNKGFLVERFIKPPVSLSFEFICNINISYVVIGCKVGAQKTTGIEIFCESNSNQFDSVGSGILGDSKSGFVFHRHYENTNNALQDQYLFRTFKSIRSLSSTQSVLLKIFRTSGTTLPALSKVEIWGIPCDSVHLSKIIQEKNILSVKEKNLTNLSAVSPKTPIISPSSSLNSFHHDDSKFKDISHNTSLSIPEDFIDPITCEIMTQPIILPSGKVVDNKTLESYIKVEEQWGRSPSDPFTGIPFNTSHKPIAAADLKVRLDKYLSENSTNPDFMNIPRCLGRNFPSKSSKNNVSTATVSKLIGNNMSTEEMGRSNNHIIIKQGDAKRTNHTSKTDKPFCSWSDSSRNKSEDSIKRKRDLFQGNNDDSLDLALKSTLSKLPKLTENKPDSNQLTILCQICKSLENLFIIPCSHYICRVCLVNSKEKDQRTCIVCKGLYRSSDVKKVHL